MMTFDKHTHTPKTVQPVDTYAAATQPDCPANTSSAFHKFAASGLRRAQPFHHQRVRVALLLLVVLLPGLFYRGARSAAVRPTATTPLQGEAALTELKQRGQYDSLAQAMQATRYQVRATDAPATFVAANPAQGYHTTFTPAGVELAAAGGTGWRLGLKLRSVGYGTRQASVSAGELLTQGSRVELRRRLTSSPHSASLTEWYENRPVGLEQGFTLNAAPGARQAGEALEVTLQLDHGWQAQVAADAQAATLSSADGQTQLHYEHLVVTDATGRPLAARMIAADGALRLAVQDAGAQYPVTIDPTITQQAYLKASNTGGADQFGYSVAVAGDTVVVGAYQEASNATSVNGDGTNNSASNSGAAYVFTGVGVSNAPPTLGNYANTSIALSGNTTVTPDAAPTGTTSINVATSTNFKGTFAASPMTGVVTVTDAHPAGTYTVTLTASGAGGSTTKTFTLTVNSGMACAGTIGFTNGADASVGTSPISVAIGDFNQDGKQDLAVANYSSATVSIRLGDGLGGFSGATNVSVGPNPESVAIGDFNQDGKQDLAVASGGSTTVSILLGDGAGGFSGMTAVSVASNSKSVALGDFNNDGKQDLARMPPSRSAWAMAWVALAAQPM